MVTNQTPAINQIPGVRVLTHLVRADGRSALLVVSQDGQTRVGLCFHKGTDMQAAMTKIPAASLLMVGHHELRGPLTEGAVRGWHEEFRAMHGLDGTEEKFEARFLAQLGAVLGAHHADASIQELANTLRHERTQFSYARPQYLSVEITTMQRPAGELAEALRRAAGEQESREVVVVELEHADSKHPRARGAEYLRFVQDEENLARWNALTGAEHLVLAVTTNGRGQHGCGEYNTWASCGCGYYGGCLEGRTTAEMVRPFLNKKFAHVARANKLEHRAGLVVVAL